MPAMPPGVPPKPDGSAFLTWLRTPRPEATPGVWRFGYRPRQQESAGRVSDRALLAGAVGALLAALLVWSLWTNNLVPHKRILLELVTPSDWWSSLDPPRAALTASAVYDSLFATLVLYYFARVGNWKEVIQRYVTDRPQPSRALRAAVLGGLSAWLVVWHGLLSYYKLAVSVTPADWLFVPGDPEGTLSRLKILKVVLTLLVLWPFAMWGDWLGLLRGVQRARTSDGNREAMAAATGTDWPELHAHGQNALVERLADEGRSGRMNDVDCARIRRAWKSVVADPARLDAFSSAVLREGARACLHPSGQRDLPVRTARHDLLTSQVRIGRYADVERTPPAHRAAGAAVDPATLGTSLLAVGPSGSGKTDRLVRPVAESLALQALAGQAALVMVCAAGTPMGPDQAYDIVIKPGDRTSEHDLDLYGGTDDPDEAAALLADVLAGDWAEVDLRRAATVLAQLLGPFRAAHGRFPSVPELRELLDGEPSALDRLKDMLDPHTHSPLHRELDARVRQAGVPGDPGIMLADRLGCLDRPVFTGFFDTSTDARPFTLRSLDHPLRVRIDLPERAHPEAAQLLARLLLAQFAASMATRPDRSLFACLVLDDATHAITAGSVRALRRLRESHAGVVLSLRALGDVPEHLRQPLIAAVGCHAAFPGITTWEGALFAQAWGTEWVETKEVAKHTVYANQPLTRLIHAVRKLGTGKPVTTDAVTVRQVERERWSASELAHGVPAGHAVLSLTSVRGEHAPPLLVDLRG
ncbi:ATP/GTP-binding protein [Streptomyces sp. FXJ1.172]|uniref:ATP/GTP-binding protein n=1 Tax=Streptomyces sp. FXJ1.172 TaxID=710705 RepID=UPI001F2E7C83|nr:ATP/GTP-binding protein [Streptomyces sp. FXJ1.172]WEO94983.1 ATP/GTP-binding protein [Streptomyces sp. FXJ1.172]